jgi:hypothetical protein
LVKTLSIEGEGFRLEGQACSERTLAAAERCTLKITFQSSRVGRHTATLRAEADSGSVEARISADNNPPPDPGSGKPPDAFDKRPTENHIPRRPVLRSAENVVNEEQDAWRTPMTVAGGLLLLLVVFAAYLRRYQRIPIDPPPPWKIELPRHFPFERVGGTPAPRLDRQILGHLADCMGYFRSWSDSHRLDIRRSILATVAQGGIPQLRFESRKRLRQLVILEDGRAGQAVRLNPIGSELGEGMQRLGIEVLKGRYDGDPAVAWDDQGRAFYLDDLEAQRNGLLLLIFGDARRVTDRKSVV